MLENVNTGKVFYVLSELDEVIINNIKEYVEEWSMKKKKEYNIHHTEDISLNGVTELFDGTKVFS